eukprot:TRINITY_DN5575_c0_g1_i2.p1 TRINITY_DN5575_c0_g1~~TRINITY_DN5575_c0_g1_i2.p1  ORF type:complete len:426 (+),score=134.59 TRINITY_DN5575_c0_g1_i2:56-1333(+)
MASSQLRLSIRVGPADAFELEIEDTETVEDLGVVIFSMRPDLGEELRLVHRGRLLKKEDELRKCSIQSGDFVAVARMPKAAQPPELIQAAAAASAAAAAAAVAAAEAAAVPSPAKDESGCESSKGYPSPVSSDAVAQVDKPQEERIVDDKPGEDPCPTTEKDSNQEESPSAQPDVDMQCTTDVVEADKPASQSNPTLENDLPQESPCASADVEMQDTPDEQPDKHEGDEASAGKPGVLSQLEEMTPGAALLELAKSLENGTLDCHPATLVAALRSVAARVESLEGNFAEASQALMLLNHLSARALQGLGAGGGGGLAGLVGSNGSAQEEAPRSFLVKKGDSDLQELHRQPPVLKRGTSGGGTLSSASTPMSKEDMDKARKARLDKLEEQQASKKRELEEAEERSKSREAMFNRHFVGAAKPMGKF